MANPRPTAGQIGLITLGAVAGAGLSLGVLGIGGAIGGAIIGAGAAIGGIPYFRAVERHKKSGG